MSEGVLEWEAGRTWYRVEGDLGTGGLAPLVVLHGGPGAAHDYLEPVADLATVNGRPCVLYDQIGCGRSQHLPEAPADFWTVGLFGLELAVLLGHLGISGRYHVLGQSWGGMLGMEHALGHPSGLRSLVVANSPASIELWVSEANRLRGLLPREVQDTLTRHEAAGTTDSEEYEQAVMQFYERHLCRIPFPDCLRRSFAQLAEDPTVYHTMNGPSEFHVIGTLRGWDITPRLGDVRVPVLVISGEHDEATPVVVRPLVDALPNALGARRGRKPLHAPRTARALSRARRNVPVSARQVTHPGSLACCEAAAWHATGVTAGTAGIALLQCATEQPEHRRASGRT